MLSSFDLLGLFRAQLRNPKSLEAAQFAPSGSKTEAISKGCAARAHLRSSALLTLVKMAPVGASTGA